MYIRFRYILFIIKYYFFGRIHIALKRIKDIIIIRVNERGEGEKETIE